MEKSDFSDFKGMLDIENTDMMLAYAAEACPHGDAIASFRDNDDLNILINCENGPVVCRLPHKNLDPAMVRLFRNWLTMSYPVNN